MRKEWYNVNVPSIFGTQVPTLTPANKSAGQKIAADSLKGRVFEISLADLNKDATNDAYRKMKVQVEEVKGFDCYTNFYGMDMTRDKLCTLVKKWHTLVEAFVQAKTNDGYLIRMFCIGFTKRHRRQVKATVYAKNSQQKLIRQKMMEIMVAECQKSTLKELFDKFTKNTISEQITKECSKIFPLDNVTMKKVKVLKKPKFDLSKLMELYTQSADRKITPAGAEASNLLNKA